MKQQWKIKLKTGLAQTPNTKQHGFAAPHNAPYLPNPWIFVEEKGHPS